jgi:hypothetical protein
MHLNELEVMVQSHNTADGTSGLKLSNLVGSRVLLTSEAIRPQSIYLFPSWKYYNSSYCE